MRNTVKQGLALLTAFFLASSIATAQDRAGEEIYRRRCASCHGPNGEGTKDNPDPLTGKRSLEGVTRFIIKKMPEDAPKKCVGEDAKRVAAYIYEAFYSPAAQLRNQKPRIELSRLTVRQYRNAVADLLGTFSTPGKWSDQRGLKAEFFNSGRRIRENRRVLSRVDATIDFDFGEKAPARKLKQDEYAVRWSGGLLAPDTGEYEFILESPNGTRLWLNDSRSPLIDEWVRSGTETKYRNTVYLLGGRIYPVRVEVFKAKAKEKKNNEKTASITFKWKRPERAEEIVPARFLSPGRFPETLIVGTAFPPDDQSMGYERGTSVSKAWDESTTHAALDVAASVVSRLEPLTGGKIEAPRLREFLRRFAERAFRRPLAEEQRKFFVDRHFEGKPNLELAVKKAVLLILKSPRFLYPETGTKQADAYDVASRISFALWDSLPDRELLEAAKNGKLDSREGVARQIERMIPDRRTRAKIRDFYYQWLRLDRLHELSKDSKRYPKFTEQIVSDLRTSLDLFLEDVTWSKASDFRQLLIADFVYLNDPLAAYYGAKLPKGKGFRKVKLEPEKHAGILTHPLLMAGFAYDSTSSPIHRGVWVARSLLGRRLRPPPDAVTPEPPDLHPKLTTRERISTQTRPATCMSCHGMINPLGFSLEHYDAVGRFRTKDRGRPIDASGGYKTLEGKAIEFKGARELGTFLAGSDEARAAFVERLFQYLIKQPIQAYGPRQHETLRRDFAKNDCNVRRLLVEMVTSAALGGRNINTKGNTK